MNAHVLEPIDLGQFRGVDDALEQLANSRVYEEILRAAFGRAHEYTLLTVFA